MRSRHESLAKRQQALLRRSALLRFELGQQGKSLQSTLGFADHAYGVLQWLRAHPQWPVAGLLLLSLSRSRRILGWMPRLWWGWDLIKKVRRMWAA